MRCGAQITPGSAGPSDESIAGYAGFWKRLAACVIDGIIIDVASTLIFLIFGLNVLARVADTTSGYNARLGFWGLVMVIVTWLYFALMESSQQQATVGKMALGVVVTDLNGNRVSFRQATARFWGKILSLVSLIGFVMIGFTERRQALHDRMAKTLVVNKVYH